MNRYPDKAFRIIQLSDSHVSADPGALYRDVDPRAALETVLVAAACWQPDLLLVTGDLSDDYSEDAYAFLARKLSDFGIPVVTLPGNHDHAERQKKHFPETAVETPWIVDAGEWQVILLNSSIEGRVAGRLTGEMCEGLESALGENSRPKLLALHHQPVAVGSRWIDRHALHRADDLWSIVDGRDEIRAVLWGHVHHAFRERRNGILLLGAPSTAANSYPFEEQFRADPAGPACRWIRLGAGGMLATGILRSSEGLSPGEAPARE